MIDNVILLCSEITKGMKSYGPKAFIPVGPKNKQKPLIIKQIDSIFDKCGSDTNVYIVIGFEHDKFLRILDQFYPSTKYSNITHIYNELYFESNNAYAVGLALNIINSGNCLIVQNGILTNYCPKNNSKSLLPILKNNTNDSFNIGLTLNNKTVQYAFYDLPNKWSEILYINRSDICKIKELITKYDLKQKFLFEFINILIDNHITFETEYISPKNISKITTHKINL